jgi:hypothetical protein
MFQIQKRCEQKVIFPASSPAGIFGKWNYGLLF